MSTTKGQFLSLNVNSEQSSKFYTENGTNVEIFITSINKRPKDINHKFIGVSGNQRIQGDFNINTRFGTIDRLIIETPKITSKIRGKIGRQLNLSL